ncbi:MAG: S41 family peptidase [Candidatus Krumholzibacteriia bacterium]
MQRRELRANAAPMVLILGIGIFGIVAAGVAGFALDGPQLAREITGVAVAAAQTPPGGTAAGTAAALGFEAAPMHLMRHADIHGDRIVFTYEDDLWLVDARGGDASRLTSHPGVEVNARFSPDGRLVAFTGQYDGGTDVYVMDARGGAPRRLTHHPSADQVMGWHPDGERVLFRSARTHPHGQFELWLVPLRGGMPEKVPVDRGGLAAFSPDGRSLAYNRISRETRTWKRYQGGMAQDIWLARLDGPEAGRGDERDAAGASVERVTDWEGTDNYPMWEDEGLFFTSDREDDTLNLYRLDPATGEATRLTAYRDYDVKEPASGPGRIVFRQGEQLHVLHLDSGEIDDIEVRIPSDLVRVRPRLVPVEPEVGGFGLSPAGERLVLEARGEILTFPADEGEPRNLTGTSGTREKHPAWSPDGRRVVFISDRTGEEELWLVDHRGGEWRQLTRQGGGMLLPPVWSPDGEHILFGDMFMRLNLVDVESGRVTVIDRGEYDDAWERWGIQDYVWSPDSRWVAYSRNGDNMHEVILLYSLDTGETSAVTDPMSTSWSPSFDPEGRFLWFLSNRTFEPLMGRQDQNFVFLEMARPYLVLLRGDRRSPFLPDQGDVAVNGDGDAGDGAGESDQVGDSGATAAVRIDLPGLADRVLAADGVAAGNYFRLEATADGCLFLRKNEPEFLKYQNVNDRTTGELDLVSYDLDDQKTETLLGGIANYHLSADGEKLVYRAGDRYGVVSAGQQGEVGDGLVDLSGIRIRVQRRDEFAQMFREAWRIQRDWFYDPDLHGVDWDAVYEKYARFVPEVGTRGDLNYLIGEMIAELNVGHTYVWGGDLDDGVEPVQTGMLAADFRRQEGADFYRIDQIVPAVAGEPNARSPLAEPGLPVQEGDYLIAIDGREIRVGDNVWAALEDRAGRVVEIAVNDRPRVEGARRFRVETLRSERGVRYRAWVDATRRQVDELSGGRIGYLHLPNMMEPGLVEFGRWFYPQALRPAFIIDDRFNGGGFVGDMIIDRLERRLWGVTKPREGGVGRNPERAFHGPLVVLVNELTGSNGEYFAQAIKSRELGTVVGTRTWGGAVGIEPHQDLMDLGAVTPPQFGLYGLTGEWLIEGRGVEPHLVVENPPAEVVAGRDPQLEAAVEMLLRRLEEEGDSWAIPPVPDFPVKSRRGGPGRR